MREVYKFYFYIFHIYNVYVSRENFFILWQNKKISPTIGRTLLEDLDSAAHDLIRTVRNNLTGSHRWIVQLVNIKFVKTATEKIWVTLNNLKEQEYSQLIINNW